MFTWDPEAPQMSSDPEKDELPGWALWLLGVVTGLGVGVFLAKDILCR